MAERARGAQQLPALAEGVEVRKEKEIADPSEAHKGTRLGLTGGGRGGGNARHFDRFLIGLGFMRRLMCTAVNYGGSCGVSVCVCVCVSARQLQKHVLLTHF